MSSQKASYTLVLTHDVDHIALKNYPIFSNMTLEFFKQCIWINFLRYLRGDLSFFKYIDSLIWCLVYPLVKLGWHPDPWEESVKNMLEMERKHNVRSTLFFIPFKDRNGHVSPGKPAKGRAIKYDLKSYRLFLAELENDGWEVGVHGIDAHISPKNATEEINVLRKLMPQKSSIGLRMHWLFQSEILWKNLKEAGFTYDATFGNNNLVGFPDKKYTPFQKDGIWVIPVNIQEGTLLGYWHQGKLPYEPWSKVEEILAEAKKNRAVVTILWHNHAFGVYHYHGDLYEKILIKAKADGARICRCIDVINELESQSY